MTQKEKVLNYINQKGESHYKEISKELDILTPNIRRILGVGAKEGIFERINDGLYKITIEGKELLYLYQGDCLDILPKLIDEGIKADNIFLDIPYNTPAVKGGNRGIKYETISIFQFNKLLELCNKLLRNETSTITYMYSNAISGLKEMKKYTDCFVNYGFTPIKIGEYHKLYKDLSPVKNMRGEIMKPEGIIIFSKSKNSNITQNLIFKEIRPRGYQTEKASNMIKSLIETTSKEGDTIVDPFAGSGVFGIEGIKLNRKAILIDKSKESIKYICQKLAA